MLGDLKMDTVLQMWPPKYQTEMNNHFPPHALLWMQPIMSLTFIAAALLQVCTGNCVRNLAKAWGNSNHWSSIHAASHLTVEGNWEDLRLVKPHWLLPCCPFCAFMSLDMVSSRICSKSFPGTVVRLTGLSFPGSSFLPFLKMGVTCAFSMAVVRTLPQLPRVLKNDVEWPCNDITQLPQCPQVQPVWSHRVSQVCADSLNDL